MKFERCCICEHQILKGHAQIIMAAGRVHETCAGGARAYIYELAAAAGVQLPATVIPRPLAAHNRFQQNRDALPVIASELTDADRHILLHSIGATEPGRSVNRNHYCASIGTADYDKCVGLCGLGCMARGQIINDGRSQYFHVTPLGANSVGRKLPKPESAGHH